MNNFYGIFWKNLRGVDPSVVDHLNSGHEQINQGSIISFSKNRFFFKSLGICSEVHCFTITTKMYFIYVYGRIDNDHFYEILSAGNEETDQYIHLNIEKTNAKLRGEFVILLYNKKVDQLKCIRDQLGIRPFYYYENDILLSFSSEMMGLFRLPDFVLQIDEHWIADSISAIISEKSRTPYLGIKRLLPGHVLTINTNIQIDPYWDLRVKEEYQKLDHLEAVDRFSSILKGSIEKRSDKCKRVGCELSGGLDSSGVTALAHRYLQKKDIPIYTFSHAFSESNRGKYYPFKDEKVYSEKLISYSGITRYSFCYAEELGIINTLKNTIKIQSGPTQQGFDMFSDTLYDCAQEFRIDRLLSGFGGDEGVSSGAYGLFDELRLKGKRKNFRDEFLLKEKQKNNSRFKAEIMFILSYYFPFTKNFVNRLINRTSWLDNLYSSLYIDEEFKNSKDIKTRFFEMNKRADDPILNDRNYKRIMHNHVPQRFEYSFCAAQHRGIDYAYPLLDIDLLECYFSLPSNYKFEGGMGRAMYRHSLKGIVPDEIRLRTDKSYATIPTVQQRLINDYDNIRNLILHCQQVNRFHYLDYNKMLSWLNRNGMRSKKAKSFANPRIFFNSLQILLLQEFERNGEFKTGIRY